MNDVRAHCTSTPEAATIIRDVIRNRDPVDPYETTREKLIKRRGESLTTPRDQEITHRRGGRRLTSRLNIACYEEACRTPIAFQTYARTFPTASLDENAIHPCGYEPTDIGESSRGSQSSNGGDAN
ncbi:hypothetical protein TNIN_92191 [Trichonephila inaurata madagascariensis]|uniref:Uncharacterized protein n=1 Tax=Trichonephila inaurata madagascariensis TaxID=2747483 RepID=A0A8X7CUB6_9ARAC|nr:hypothetical protein TNIN_92191 [Trichonephila inaurata madagascariensis]